MAVTDFLSLHTEGGFELQDVLDAPDYGLATVVLTSIGTFSSFGFLFSKAQ